MTAYVNLQNETWIFESINLQIDALEVDNNLAKEHGKQIQQVLTGELHLLWLEKSTAEFCRQNPEVK